MRTISVQITCPTCNQRVTTIKRTWPVGLHILHGFLCVVTVGWWLLVYAPLMHRIKARCPNCDANVEQAVTAQRALGAVVNVHAAAYLLDDAARVRADEIAAERQRGL